MKIVLFALVLFPTLAMAYLDDSVANGSSSTEGPVVSMIKDEGRVIASEKVQIDSQEFKFPDDGYDVGTSIK